MTTYEPALLNRFAKVEVTIEDLLHAISRERKVASDLNNSFFHDLCPRMNPGDRTSASIKLTDLVPACPANLIEMIALSVGMQSPSQDINKQEFINKCKQLVVPLLAPEYVQEAAEFSSTQIRSESPWWLHPNRTFTDLVVDAIKYTRASEKMCPVVAPVIVPTFSNIDHIDLQNLQREASALAIDATTFRSIVMTRVMSHSQLRDHLNEYLEVLRKYCVADVNIVSSLQVHVDMGQDNARDMVDYLRFQLEWCAENAVHIMRQRSEKTRALSLHLIALVIHGKRGSEIVNASFRPFLLADTIKGFVANNDTDIGEVECMPWRGVAVDHFSDVLPWGVESSPLYFDGTRLAILGLDNQEESNIRFNNMVLDALPQVIISVNIPKLDQFSALMSLATSFELKPDLAEMIKSNLGYMIENEMKSNDVGTLSHDAVGDTFNHANEWPRGWRRACANNLMLLRRTSSFHLALLSSLRIDKELVPLIRAVLLHDLHSSCPIR
jgi:hypothetical protein